MLRVRYLLGIALLGLAACAADDEPAEDVVMSDDAALTALEADIGFDGAVSQLDESALEAIDDNARTLEAMGRSPREVDQTTTKKTLSAVLKKGALKTKTLQLQDVYDSDLFKLNGMEQALCKAHRIVCVRVALAGFKARSASQAAFHDGNVGGRIDCFRHTYWNAGMTRAVGADYAKQWGDAHENGYPENRATKRDALLSDMDFFNNNVGRSIGVAHADDSDSETKAAVRAAITKGEVRAVRYDLGDRSGTLVPSSQCTDATHCGT